MDKLDVIFTTVFGSSLITFVVAKWLGRKKEDIEIALNYQDYYDKFIQTLKKEVEELKHENIEQKKLIEEQKKNLDRWEENCERLQNLLKAERIENKKLIKLMKNEN
jgi:predicted RNase H-like nuclease (RuvC/YqgF family)